LDSPVSNNLSRNSSSKHTMVNTPAAVAAVDRLCQQQQPLQIRRPILTTTVRTSTPSDD